MSLAPKEDIVRERASAMCRRTGLGPFRPVGYNVAKRAFDVRCRSFRNDMRWTWRKLARRKPDRVGQSESAGWELNERSTWRVLVDTLRLFSGLDRIDTFTWDDPRPFFAELRQMAGSLFSRLAQRLIGSERRPQPIPELQQEATS